ncbi:hypothetical protein DPV78_009794 [Talaromyces pinophilus]|nr:hypothetical protein DPV78_009794 [Talaromyces pinophilus]
MKYVYTSSPAKSYQTHHKSFRLLSGYSPPPAAPTILNPPALLPSAINEYANQYLVGCHATAGTPALAAILCTLSPVSAWKISNPFGPTSSLAPHRNLPSKLQLTPRIVPPPSLDTVRRQTQSVVSQSEIKASLPPTAK